MAKMKITKTQLDIIITPEIHGNKKIFSARAIQLPNVVSQGDSIEEAEKMLHEALSLYFEEAPKEKEKITQIIKEEECQPLISRMFF